MHFSRLTTTVKHVQSHIVCLVKVWGWFNKCFPFNKWIYMVSITKPNAQCSSVGHCGQKWTLYNVIETLNDPVFLQLSIQTVISEKRFLQMLFCLLTHQDSKDELVLLEL